jgi:hypothetical protein
MNWRARSGSARDPRSLISAGLADEDMWSDSEPLKLA